MEARNLPSHGVSFKISELQQMTGALLDGISVRITGRLTSHNPAGCEATLCDSRNQSELVVDTSLVEPFQAANGCIVQFIGETDASGDDGTVRLCARVVRMLHGFDLTLYHKALLAQRSYLDSQAPTHDN